MASKTVSDLKIKLGLENSQVFNRLRGSFRDLEKTVGVTDKGIEELRKSLKNYSSQSNNSIKVLRGQITALKDLKDQARIGGAVFKSLTDDIKLYEKQLKAVEMQATKTAKAVSAQVVESRFTKLGVAGLEQQLGLRRKSLEGITPLTNEYANALGGVLQVETALTRLRERQAVIAANVRTVTFTPARGGKGEFDSEALAEYAGVFKQLPNTAAAFGQRLKELRQDFANLDVGSDKYLSTLREIAAVQRQIARAERIEEVEGQDRELLGRQDRLEAFVERRRGRRTRLGARVSAESAAFAASEAAARRAAAPVPAQVREISGLYQQIGDIGMSRTRARIDAMGNSYRQVTRDIKAATAASNGSLNSLQSQRAAWSTLRAGLRPATAAYREVTKEIARVDRQLAKLDRRRGLSGKNLLAGVGGAASGAVFGGPEAAIGGLIGGVIGGVPGAAIGAAGGAQLSALRQQASAVAQFAGELNLAKTTLAQASTGFKDYNRLLKLAREVSADYSVSLKPAIAGLAQIATAARANNLSFEDTEKIYRGLIASNVAFGKSQEDLDAIIRATVQVLSKGKVSAEELSGQIGERLPGAVAKFAAANDMTLAQLSKAFKDGEVTIAQFVRFTAAQGEEYDGVAQLIAEGPEKAGIRLQIALEQAGENFGGFFLKVGSGFQDYLTNLVTFVNENQDKIKDVIVDVKIAAAQIVEIVQTLIEDIKEAVGPIFRFISENLNRGIGAVYSKVREGRELRVGGFDFDTASKQAEKSVRELGYDPIFTPRLFAQSFDEAMDVLRQQARQRGREILGEGVQSDAVSRQQIKESLFGFTPTSFGGAPGLTPGGGGDDDDATKSKDISKAQADMLVKIANLRRQGLTVQAEILEFERALLATKEKADKPEQARVDRAKALETFTARMASALKGMGSDYMKVSKEMAEQEKLNKQFNFDLKERQFELGLITQEEYNRLQIERERARLKDAYPDLDAFQREEMVELKRQELDPTTYEEISQNIGKLKRELEELLNPAKLIIGAANSIGTAFTQSFMSVIDGSATTQEALAGFFRNVGQYFLDMASQIIAKMITMAILNSVVNLLPGGSFNLAPASAGTGVGYGGGAATDAFKTGTSGIGGSFFPTSTPFKPFAMGGIVDKPTLFKYANGGTGRFGLMGEAGPEAILPLKRGADGKLGVAGGGGVNVGEINITVENRGDQLSPAAQKQIANQVQGIVLANLVNERRSGGILR